MLYSTSDIIGNLEHVSDDWQVDNFVLKKLKDWDHLCLKKQQ